MPIPVPQGQPLNPDGIYAQGPDGSYLDLSDMNPSERDMSPFDRLSPDDIHATNIHMRYGSLAQSAAGLAEQAASGLTAGWSRNLEVKAGVPLEDIQGRAEDLGVAGDLANLTGMVAGLKGARAIAGALGGGAEAAGALGEGAAGAASVTAPVVEAAPGITEGAAELATPWGGDALTQASTEASGVGDILASAGSAARAAGPVSEGLGGSLTGRMLEGALTQGAYGAGQEMSEEDLAGSVGFNSEAVIHAAGLGAAVGAGMEGLFGLAGRAIPAAAGRLGSALGTLGAISADGFKALSGLVTGQGKEVMAKLWADRVAAVAEGGFRDLYSGQFQDFAKKAGKGFADMLNAGQDISKEGRAALRQDFVDTLFGEDPVEHMKAASAQLDVFQQALDTAKEDPNKYGRVEMVNSYQGKVDALQTDLERIRGKIEGKLTDPTTPPVWGSEAGDIFKAMDDFRKDAQDGVNYKGLALKQVPREHLATLNWARGIAQAAQAFTKNPAVWGDVGTRWAAWQTADAARIAANEAFLAKMGAKEFGKRVVDPSKMAGMFNKVYADGDAYAGRLMGAMQDAHAGLNRATQDVYSQIPSRSYDPSRLDGLLNNVAALRDKALDAKNMSDVVKELSKGRGGMNVGTVGFGAYLAGKLGITAGAAAPLAAIYATARAASRPIGAIEGFARVAQAVTKLNKAIPAGAKDALDGLLKTAQYGARAEAQNMAREHLLANQLTARPKDNSDTPEEAAYTLSQNISSMIANPEQSAVSVGHAWMGLPPETRAMGVAKATNILKVNAARQSRPLPAVSPLGFGSQKPRMTPADASKAARILHVSTDPVNALGAHLKARDLTADDVAVATASMPETTAKWQGELMARVQKLKPEEIPLGVQSQLAIAFGRPAWPLGYAAVQQSGYGHVGAMTAPGQVTGNARADARKFKSKQSEDVELPSEREVT